MASNESLESIRLHLAEAGRRSNTSLINQIWVEEILPMIHNALDMVLTVNEVARIMGISRWGVHRLIASGKLLARKSGGVWLILRSSLPQP